MRRSAIRYPTPSSGTFSGTNSLVYNPAVDSGTSYPCPASNSNFVIASGNVVQATGAGLVKGGYPECA